ncbi:MAG: cysteine desulfurase [Myxococcota bacterium]
MSSPFDLEQIRSDFPALATTVRDKPLTYLDNASTTQKPNVVLDSIRDAYVHACANVHRGVHKLSADATERYEAVRVKAQNFLNASEHQEVVFTSGTTEAINLVANTVGRTQVWPGDNVLITELEHHSNLVPWQMLCAERQAQLRVLPIDDHGDLRLERLPALLDHRTKIVAFSHICNSLGTVNPVIDIVKQARQVGAISVVDGAQAAPHGRIDVRALGCDFYALSGHKVFGPTGVGLLWGRRELLESIPPYKGGGDMILSVSIEDTTYNDVPYKFEAGTPNIAGVIGLGAALDYVQNLDLDAVAHHEQALLASTLDILRSTPGVRIIGEPRYRAGVISFVVDGVHPHDVGTILDLEGIAVRTGHHCTQPVMEHFDVPATVRVSFAVYNTLEEVERLADGLHRVRSVFS